MPLCFAVTAANPLFCLVGLLQLVGLLVAGATRFTQGTPYERDWTVDVPCGPWAHGHGMRHFVTARTGDSNNERRNAHTDDNDCYHRTPKTSV